MRFSIHNINSFSNILFVLVLLSGLNYGTITSNLFHEAIFLLKIWLIFFMLMNVFVIIFVIYKFRVIIVSEEYITIVYPLKLQIIKHELSRIKKTNWSSFIPYNSIYYRKVTLYIENQKPLELTDREFENLDSLANLIPSVKNDSNNAKLKEINFERAENNKSEQFNSLLFLSFLLFAIICVSINMEEWSNIKVVVIVVLSSFLVLLLGFNLKRYLLYKKTSANSW